jgi:hypothetical protein
MLAPAVLWLLASLTSSPAPCLASPSSSHPGQPPLLNTDDFNHAAFWEGLKKSFTPPAEPLRSPYGPQPEPRHPHLRERDTAARPPVEFPARSMQLSRLYRPWGDGFVRMPVQRQKLNETGGRRPRAGRMRRPNKSTYPANNGNSGGLAPNVTMAPLPTTVVAETASGNATPAGSARRRRSIPARDVAIGNPAAAQAQPAPAAAEKTDKDKPPGYQAKPSWAWSHLDDYEGLTYMIMRASNPLHHPPPSFCCRHLGYADLLDW